MAVCMGANPQGLEYGQHYRRAGNRPLDDGKYCLILQKQRPEHFVNRPLSSRQMKKEKLRHEGLVPVSKGSQAL